MVSILTWHKDTIQPVVMGILNITPDSFSDGASFMKPDKAIEHALKMVNEGADIIDVGGESTRPGSDSVSESEELRRVVPVISQLKKLLNCKISIDTTKPLVAREAVLAGADMINDVSMLRFGTELAEIAAEFDVSLVLMHSRKTPKNMQNEILYEDVIKEVSQELVAACQKAQSLGCKKEKIWVDPGIGFAKNVEQNIEIHARLDEIVALGYPVLMGPSRKSFIGQITGAEVDSRLGGTAAAVTMSILNGATAVRVHDVAVMKQAALIAYEVVKLKAKESKV